MGLVPITEGMFAHHLSRHIFYSAWKKKHFRGGRHWSTWQFNKSGSILTIDQQEQFKVEILGTHSNHSESWVWAWANTVAGFQEQHIHLSRSLRQFGEEHSIEELTIPEQSVDERVNHELFGMLAIGILDLPSHFHAQHDDGTVVFLILDQEASSIPQPSNLDFSSHITDVLCAVEVVSQQEAVKAFCASLGWQTEPRPDALEVRNPADPNPIQIEFDEEGRIAQIGSIISPSQAPVASRRDPARRPRHSGHRDARRGRDQRRRGH